MSSNKIWNWFKRLFCCKCCYEEDGYYQQTGDEPHYSKLTEESFLKRFPRHFFRHKYGIKRGEQISDNLKQSLLEDHQNPWVEKYKQVNEEYEMDNVYSDEQLQEKFIDDTDL